MIRLHASALKMVDVSFSQDLPMKTVKYGKGKKRTLAQVFTHHDIQFLARSADENSKVGEGVNNKKRLLFSQTEPLFYIIFYQTELLFDETKQIGLHTPGHPFSPCEFAFGKVGSSFYNWLDTKLANLTTQPGW